MPHLNFISLIAELPCILPSSEITKKRNYQLALTSRQRDTTEISAADKHEERQKLHLL